MRLTFLLFVTFLAVPHAGLAIGSDPLHLAGSRVRLSAVDRSTAAGRLSSGALKQVGTAVEVRGDSLLFRAENQSALALIPTASLTRLEVSLGTHSHVLAGAGLGFLAGVLVGGVIGGVSGRNVSDQAVPADSQSGFGAAVGALIGGGIGIVVGAAVGSTRTERWETLGLPLRMGFLPRTDAIGLSVEVALR